MFWFVSLTASKHDRHMVVSTLEENVWMLETLRLPQHKWHWSLDHDIFSLGNEPDFHFIAAFLGDCISTVRAK